MTPPEQPATARTVAPEAAPAPAAACGACGPSRRRFLERGVVLGAAGLATAGLAGCTDEIRSENDAPSHHVGGTPTRAVRAQHLQVGTSASVEVEGRTLLLRRAAEDVVLAFSAVCTHQGCTVAPATEAGPPKGSPVSTSKCEPWQGQAKTSRPASKPLTEFTAAVDGDWVTVTL